MIPEKPTNVPSSTPPTEKLSTQKTRKRDESLKLNALAETTTAPAAKPIEAKPFREAFQLKDDLRKTHLPITLEERKALAKQFKVGDVVYTKYTSMKPAGHLATVIGQKIAQFLFGKKNQEQHRMVHVGIVTHVEEGKVWVAHAQHTGSQNEMTNILN